MSAGDELTAGLTRPLRGWYDRAGVRVDPRRMLLIERELGRDFWPAHLAPVVAHPLVVARGERARQELLVQQLYQYLQFTANYELRVINRATEMIANGRSGVDVSLPVRLDAYKIYCDEGYHALYSVDVVHQVQQATGIAPRPPEFETFLRYLERIERDASPELRAVVVLLVVVVFETLITANLTQIPRDPNIVTLVRDIVTDHAEDEGRHHAFFSGFFSVLWGGLDADQRRVLGPLLPEMIVGPLQPPYETLRASLAAVGLDRDQCEQVLGESYPRPAVLRGIRETAKATIRLFQEHGVLDEPRTRERFVQTGLCP